MTIAVIQSNTVINLVCHDENNLQSSIDHLESKGYTCVISSDAKIGDNWDGVNFTTPPPQPVISPVYQWYIDIGPFFDRFGSKKILILTSADPVVKAIVTDVQVRKWVDLQRTDVNDALDVLITKGLIDNQDKQDILNKPVQSNEQLALKKLYFS